MARFQIRAQIRLTDDDGDSEVVAVDYEINAASIGDACQYALCRATNAVGLNLEDGAIKVEFATMPNITCLDETPEERAEADRRDNDLMMVARNFPRLPGC